jgi:hypothetical protein
VSNRLRIRHDIPNIIGESNVSFLMAISHVYLSSLSEGSGLYLPFDADADVRFQQPSKGMPSVSARLFT